MHQTPPKRESQAMSQEQPQRNTNSALPRPFFFPLCPGHHADSLLQYHPEAQGSREAGSHLCPKEAHPSLLRGGVHGVPGTPAPPLPAQRLLSSPGDLPGTGPSVLWVRRVSDTGLTTHPHAEHRRSGCQVSRDTPLPCPRCCSPAHPLDLGLPLISQSLPSSS